MLARRGFRYRLYPTKDQEHALAVQFGHARYVWNYALDLRRATWRESKTSIPFFDLKRRVTDLKRQPNHAWLYEADSQVLQAKIEDLQRAYLNFFEKRARFPRFKSKKGEQSIRYPQRFKFGAGRVYLPKVGWVKLVLHRALVGIGKQVTVSRTTSGDYYVSALCEVEIEPPAHTGHLVGIDLGLRHLAILSTGEKIEHPRYLRHAQRRLARLQRRQSLKKKDSKNRERARLVLARAHERVANARRDSLHKLSDRLTREFGTVKLEALNVRGMLKNRSLAKAISDSGWSSLVAMLRYKAGWRGGNVEQIDRFYPSSKFAVQNRGVRRDLESRWRWFGSGMTPRPRFGSCCSAGGQ